MGDNFIDVSVAPTRGINVIDIPYADYLVRVSVSSDNTRKIFEENIQIFKMTEDAKLVDVSSDFLLKFSIGRKVRPTGDNLMVVMAALYNAVNKEKDEEENN